MTQRSRGLGFRMRTSGILIEASSQDDVAVGMEPRPGIRCRYCHFKCVKPQAGPGLGPHLKLLLPQIFLATGDAAVLVVVVAILWILALEPLLLWELVLSVDLSVAALAHILIILMLSAMQPGNFDSYSPYSFTNHTGSLCSSLSRITTAIAKSNSNSMRGSCRSVSTIRLFRPNTLSGMR